MRICYATPRSMLPKICLLLGPLLLLRQVDGKSIAFSPDSPSQKEISEEVKTATSEFRSSSPSSEAALSNEVLPPEALVSATLRVPHLTPVSSTTDTVPEFNRDQVSLALPDDLFSSTANLTLQLRNFIGDFIMRTSVRIAQVVRFFQPLFGYHLMIDIPKEMDV